MMMIIFIHSMHTYIHDEKGALLKRKEIKLFRQYVITCKSKCQYLWNLHEFVWLFFCKTFIFEDYRQKQIRAILSCIILEMNTYNWLHVIALFGVDSACSHVDSLTRGQLDALAMQIQSFHCSKRYRPLNRCSMNVGASLDLP